MSFDEYFHGFCLPGAFLSLSLSAQQTCWMKQLLISTREKSVDLSGYYPSFYVTSFCQSPKVASSVIRHGTPGCIRSGRTETRDTKTPGKVDHWSDWPLKTGADGCVSSHLPVGGRVIFNVANDSPTLTGAKVTFTISLEFPHNQKVLPNGDVVWAEDCVLNGELSQTQLNVCFMSPVPPEFVQPDWFIHPDSGLQSFSSSSCSQLSHWFQQIPGMTHKWELTQLLTWRLKHSSDRRSPLTAGTKYAASEPVFPTQDTDWEPVFPDGTPMKKDKKPNYVFVWKAWGERSAHTLMLRVKEVL